MNCEEPKKTNLEKLLIFLSGKKGTIAIILSSTNGYLLAKAVYGELEFTLITIVLGAIFGTVSLATKKLVYKK